MPNRAKKFDLENQSQRQKRKPRAKPYFVTVEPKLTLGYVAKWPAAGHWIARRETGRTQSANGLPYPVYEQSRLGIADDLAKANGEDVLSFDQARRKAAGKNHVGPLTVALAVKHYVENLRASKGDAAAEDAAQRLNKHVLCVDQEGNPLPKKAGLGDDRVATLALTRLQKWRNGLVTGDDAVTHSTANRIMANFKAALNLAFQDDAHGIQSDKAWRALPSFEDADTAREDHFESDDVQTLIDKAHAFDPAFADLLTGLFVTGCRYGELAACDVRHFDAKRDVLSIPSGKTGARAVTLMIDAADFFRRIVKGRKGTEPLLPKEDGSRWGKSEQHRRMQRAVKDAELPSSATVYSLRHSHISRAIEEDVPLFIIARNTGTSEAMIRKHYAKLLAVKERKMLERAAGAFKLRVIPGGKSAAA